MVVKESEFHEGLNANLQEEWIDKHHVKWVAPEKIIRNPDAVFYPTKWKIKKQTPPPELLITEK